MANLSRNDRNIIAEHSLRQMAGLFTRSTSISRGKLGVAFPLPPWRRWCRWCRFWSSKGYSRLLTTLTGHEVAFNLDWKSGSENLASDLSALFRHVQKGNFINEHYHAPSHLVVKQAIPPPNAHSAPVTSPDAGSLLLDAFVSSCDAATSPFSKTTATSSQALEAKVLCRSFADENGSLAPKSTPTPNPKATSTSSQHPFPISSDIPTSAPCGPQPEGLSGRRHQFDM